MRIQVMAVAILLAACGGGGSTTPPDADDTSPRTFAFGPFTIAPGQEVVNECVQITLNNDADLYVHSVELTTGAGFHHSNWFYVPESAFLGDDGSYPCDDRGFSEPVAASFGGVLFAQSTQTPHEIQQFPEGVAIRVPAHSKLVAQIHLLNSGETQIDLSPTIAVTPIPLSTVKVQLAAISFEDEALGLPPQQASRFSVDCDLGPKSRELTGTDPAFHIYYALAHYHVLGTGMTIEALRPDGTATPIYSTQHHIGDTLGGPIDPPFDMTGYTRMRVTCDYTNTTNDVVRWGVGNQEMCVFLAFTDSAYNWGGGAVQAEAPGPSTPDGDVATFSHACTLFADAAAR